MFTEDIHKTNSMFIDEQKTWFELVAYYWQYVVGFFMALALVWQATKKTTTTGRSVLSVVNKTPA